jgi:hypothetical protein
MKYFSMKLKFSMMTTGNEIRRQEILKRIERSDGDLAPTDVPRQCNRLWLLCSLLKVSGISILQNQSLPREFFLSVLFVRDLLIVKLTASENHSRRTVVLDWKH